MKVINRNNKTVEWDDNRIIQAVAKATENALGKGVGTHADVLAYVKDQVKDRDFVSVYEIEKYVEMALMHDDPEIAREYISHRSKKQASRDGLMKYVGDAIKLTNLTNENANMPESVFTARITRIGNQAMRQYAENCLIPREHSDLHKQGWVYIHDFNSYAVGMHNCMFLDLDELLSKPVHTTNGTMRPPKSIHAALSVAAVAIQCQTNCQFGGVSVQSIDFAMDKFVKMSYEKNLKTVSKILEMPIYIGTIKDMDNIIDKYVQGRLNREEFITTCIHNMIGIETYKQKVAHADCIMKALDLTIRDTHQACEAFIHNLNHLESRAGNQLPFSSINYGCCTEWGGRLFIKSMLDCTLDGVGEKHSTPIFPQQIWQFHKNRNGEITNGDLINLAYDCSIKRVYPNYVNCNKEVYDIYDEFGNIDPRKNAATMGCRTRLGANIISGNNNKTGRGNLSPVTLNFPKIALESKNPEEFRKAIFRYARKGIEMMETRLQWMMKQTMGSAPFMYKNHTWAYKGEYNETDAIGERLLSGTLALGFIGVAEASQVLFGASHAKNKDADDFFYGLLKDLKYLCESEGTLMKRNISLYATPAESLCSTFAKQLKEQYGVIENVSDKEFITNSFHVPVWEDIDWVDKVKLEAKYHDLCTGGSITYVEIENHISHEAYASLIEGAMAEGVYYFCTNIPVDECLDCGFSDNFFDGSSEGNPKCPKCGSDDVMTLRRVTGYITGNYHKRFNSGKKQEVEMRVKHVHKK